jgi:hypothetical protein
MNIPYRLFNFLKRMSIQQPMQTHEISNPPATPMFERRRSALKHVLERLAAASSALTSTAIV